MPAPAALIARAEPPGIGLATAEFLHERGFQVMVTGQNPDTLATTNAANYRLSVAANWRHAAG